MAPDSATAMLDCLSIYLSVVTIRFSEPDRVIIDKNQAWDEVGFKLGLPLFQSGGPSNDFAQFGGNL